MARTLRRRAIGVADADGTEHTELSIIIYSLLIILVGGLVIFLYPHIRNQQGLSLSDKTNIVMTVVNLVLLILAVVSIDIAVKSYQAVQESGSQQQRTLDASKDSLSSVVRALEEQERMMDDSRRALKQSVDIMTAQQNLLQQSVETSRNQLAVLDAQWKRQLEQPDIHAVPVYPAKPAVIVMNKSKIKPVRDGLYQLIALNIDRWLGDRYQLVSNKATKVDSIRPDGSYLPSTLELIPDPNQPLEKGNRLYGYLSVSCPDCIAHRLYWVLIKYGEEGWYAELSKTDQEYSLKALSNLNPSTVDGHISSFLSRQDLIAMPKRLW
jgi:hypothetical protein